MKINLVLYYHLEFYIGDPSAVYPPELWAREITDHRDVRTTNGPESFHMGYNSKFFAMHPNIYKVIRVLLRIQEKTFMIFTDLRNGLIKKQANPQANKDENVRKVWKKYLDSQKTDEDLRKFLSILGNRFKGKKLTGGKK